MQIKVLSPELSSKIAAGEVKSLKVTIDAIRDLIGRPRVHPEQMAPADAVGVATGMFYTPMGGDIMFVEASVMAGESGLVLTGQLGDVMKESGRAAWSYARSNYERLKISDEALKGREVHIHVPAGAVPKDGPSAGITMACALESDLYGQKILRDVAMTDEITLTGRVLPIGGVKEKILGAIRSGISEIILPCDNEADLDDLQPEVRDKLTINLVEDLDQVISIALADNDASSAKKKPKEKKQKISKMDKLNQRKKI